MTRRHRRQLAGFTAMLMLSVVSIAGQERDRSRIPDQYKWDLTPLYATEQGWRAAKETAQAGFPQLGKSGGPRGPSAAARANALDSLFAVNKTLSRLSAY